MTYSSNELSILSMTDIHDLNGDKQAKEKHSGLIFNCCLRGEKQNIELLQWKIHVKLCSFSLNQALGF